jgi:anti-sigma regulatory factor (Ser/Thr protein kinase)
MDATAPKRESCLLPPSRTAPALARRFVQTVLSDWGVADAFGDVVLVTSELVTNAVQHAGTDVEVSIDLRSDRVRVEVQDQSDRHPVKADLASARDGGWGLHIVERLGAQWGLEARDGGKIVWCEVTPPSG